MNKDVMRYLIFIFLLFLSNAWAMKPLPIVELTPKLSNELGFRVSFEVTDKGTAISIAAPTNIDSCAYKRSLVEVMNADGNVVATTNTNTSVSNDEAYIDGYLADLSLSMRIGITYICMPNSGKRGKIYLIDSIKKYLISTQR